MHEHFDNGKENSRKIETLEDAIYVLLCRGYCSGTSCGDCGIYLYGKRSSCEAIEKSAHTFLCKAAEIPVNTSRKLNGQMTAYDAFLVNHVLSKSPKKNACEGTCATCSLSEEHSSGIRFCKSFGNFVHDDGYCYRFCPSDKMEETSAN